MNNRNVNLPILYFILIFIFNGIGLSLYGNDIKKSDLINSEIQNFIQSKKSSIKPSSIFNIKTVLNNKKQFELCGKTNQVGLYFELKSILKDKMFEFEDNVTLLPNTDLGENTYGLVCLSVANLRTTPHHWSELATQALMGTPLNILDKSGGWLLVQTPDNYITWTEENGISLMNKKEINRWLIARKLVYYRQFGNTYEKSSTKSQFVSDAVLCDVFEYVGESEHFYKVIYPDKRIAYVLKSECMDFGLWSNMKNPSADEIIHTAKQFMGIPYLWGGTSSKGVDCSGFTKLTFLVHGIILQRDASQQANYGKPIQQENILSHLRPANLLFFGEKKSDQSKERVTHVALYIGDGQFIHSSGRVRINSFESSSKVYSESRKNSLLKASDYIGSIGSANITKIKNSTFYHLRK